jgi:protein PET100
VVVHSASIRVRELSFPFQLHFTSRFCVNGFRQQGHNTASNLHTTNPLSSHPTYLTGFPRIPPALVGKMGGPNLEVFKVLSLILTIRPSANSTLPQFGLYIAFPIAWMYYFGTNLDARFHVPDFWPTQEQSHKIPPEKEERDELLRTLRERRERGVRRRLEEAKRPQGGGYGGAR